jgi:hypothetical protein
MTLPTQTRDNYHTLSKPQNALNIAHTLGDSDHVFTQHKLYLHYFDLNRCYPFLALATDWCKLYFVKHYLTSSRFRPEVVEGSL